MSRITKQIAEDVTKALLSKRREELKKVKDEYKGIIEHHILSLLPKKVLEVFSDPTTKNFLNTSCNFYISGQGISRTYESISQYLPYVGGNASVELPKGASTKVEKLMDKAKKMEDNIYSLKNEINASLLALGTFKRVQEQFPEAAEFLPKTSMPTSLVVNISKLRTKINS
tara:strand:- start:50 stop:562 length:513 start_codon:yes stop_codon:yes gene_type:complete